MSLTGVQAAVAATAVAVGEAKSREAAIEVVAITWTDRGRMATCGRCGRVWCVTGSKTR